MSEPVYAWTANGRRLHVDLDDARAHELVAADGDFNPLSLELWRQVVAAHAWDLVVDVGVNYGEMLVGVDLPAGARVVGFEPNPRIRELAARTMADNGLDVDLRPHAVSDAPGTARFAVDTAWSGMSSLATADSDDGGHALLDVPVTTLDAVTADAASVCVKVDVEGFEQQVLDGATRLRARDIPSVLMLETLHMAPGRFAAMAGADAVVLLRLADRRLVRVPSTEVDEALASGHHYRQDGLLVSPAALALLPLA